MKLPVVSTKEVVQVLQKAGFSYAPKRGKAFWEDYLMQEVSERIKAISTRLKKEYHAERVILYGSYARGEATEDSDVDLFIIAQSDERYFDRMATAIGIVRDLCRGLPVSPIVLTAKEVEEREKRGDQFIKEILAEGVVL